MLRARKAYETKVKTTLVVKRICNLTRTLMWVYGTSGKLIRLSPAMNPNEVVFENLSFDDGVYYVIDKNTEKRLREISDCELQTRMLAHLAKPFFKGFGKDGHSVYGFTTINGVDIAPVSERFGIVGETVF